MKIGRYRHFKGGEYQVYGVAKHTETGEELVVYRPLYGDAGLWVRPLATFQETVVRGGLEQRRFEYIDSPVGPDEPVGVDPGDAENRLRPAS